MVNNKNKPVSHMYVVKRDHRTEQVFLDKITSRIQNLCYGLNMDFIIPVSITLKVIKGLYNGVTTAELDSLAAETAATMATDHPDYAILAARIAVTNLHKETKKQFSEVMDDLYNAVNEQTGLKTPLISEQHHGIIMKHANRLNSCIIYNRDLSYNYFGFKTLERSYLLKINGKIAERPQHMLMRVAIGIHGEDIDAVIETYNCLSERYYTLASPTLFFAATPKPRLLSCFSVMMPDDSIDGICKCLTECGVISKAAGGVGVNVHNIRAKGTYIAGTNGVSNGLAPMLRVFNNWAQCIDQAGKRPSSIAIYLEPWHADVFDFLNLKKATGKDELRARDLFYALWVPDLFMERIESDGDWSLMCPLKCPGLSDCWGEKFEELYLKYESEGRFTQRIKARKLWQAVLASQVETGNPYLMYKDACNRKSNQQNLGTIKGGTFSAEIVQYSSPEEIGTCSLASIAINMFVSKDGKSFDFEHLRKVAKVVTRNLNRIIDVSFYPLPEAEKSSKRHRPIGIGVQGLADAFIRMRLPFESPEAALLNKQIFETVYYGALEASVELAETDGPYQSYDGSPVSEGVLQYDMWGVTPTDLWDWDSLRVKIAKHGVRNSLLTSVMPTSWTARILGNNGSVEPYASNVYTRRVSAGEIQVVNPHLLKELNERRLWDDAMKNRIIEERGSVQNVPTIPDEVKRIYKTAWEISNKVILNMAADRGAFVDHSQALNLYVAKPTYAVLTSMHYYAWRKGLKTGTYFLRTKSSTIQFSQENGKGVDKAVKNGNSGEDTEVEDAVLACSLRNPENCEMCGA